MLIDEYIIERIDHQINFFQNTTQVISGSCCHTTAGFIFDNILIPKKFILDWNVKFAHFWNILFRNPHYIIIDWKKAKKEKNPPYIRRVPETKLSREIQPSK